MSEQINAGNVSDVTGYGMPSPPAGSTPHTDTSSGLRPPSPQSGEGDGGRSATRTTLRLPPVPTIAPEKMTTSQLIQAQRDHQAGIGLECEVRRLAREQGLDAQAATKLGEAARMSFRIVKGEPIPVAADRQTVLLAADGVNVLSVTEWVARQARGAQPRGEDGRWMPEEDEVLPMRNPFRRKTWNLTEQMRLQRRDPRLAKRLKAEAYAAGEN